MKKFTQNEQIQFVRHMLITNQNWAEAALLKIYDKQTEDEKEVKDTKYHNLVGFTISDAKFLSGCAITMQIQHHVTAEQLPILFRTIGKYARQLYLNETFNHDKLVKLMERKFNH